MIATNHTDKPIGVENASTQRVVLVPGFTGVTDKVPTTQSGGSVPNDKLIVSSFKMYLFMYTDF